MSPTPRTLLTTQRTTTSSRFAIRPHSSPAHRHDRAESRIARPHRILSMHNVRTLRGRSRTNWGPLHRRSPRAPRPPSTTATGTFRTQATSRRRTLHRRAGPGARDISHRSPGPQTDPPRTQKTRPNKCRSGFSVRTGSEPEISPWRGCGRPWRGLRRSGSACGCGLPPG